MKDFSGSYMFSSNVSNRNREKVRKHPKCKGCRCFSPYVRFHNLDCPFSRGPCPVHGSNAEGRTQSHSISNNECSFEPMQAILMRECCPATILSVSRKCDEDIVNVKHRKVQTESECFIQTNNNGSCSFGKKIKETLSSQTNKIKKCLFNQSDEYGEICDLEFAGTKDAKVAFNPLLPESRQGKNDFVSIQGISQYHFVTCGEKPFNKNDIVDISDLLGNENDTRQQKVKLESEKENKPYNVFQPYYLFPFINKSDRTSVNIGSASSSIDEENMKENQDMKARLEAEKVGEGIKANDLQNEANLSNDNSDSETSESLYFAPYILIPDTADINTSEIGIQVEDLPQKENPVDSASPVPEEIRQQDSLNEEPKTKNVGTVTSDENSINTDVFWETPESYDARSNVESKKNSLVNESNLRQETLPPKKVSVNEPTNLRQDTVPPKKDSIVKEPSYLRQDTIPPKKDSIVKEPSNLRQETLPPKKDSIVKEPSNFRQETLPPKKDSIVKEPSNLRQETLPPKTYTDQNTQMSPSFMDLAKKGLNKYTQTLSSDDESPIPNQTRKTKLIEDGSSEIETPRTKDVKLQAAPVDSRGVLKYNEQPETSKGKFGSQGRESLKWGQDSYQSQKPRRKDQEVQCVITQTIVDNTKSPLTLIEAKMRFSRELKPNEIITVTQEENRRRVAPEILRTKSVATSTVSNTKNLIESVQNLRAEGLIAQAVEKRIGSSSMPSGTTKSVQTSFSGPPTPQNSFCDCDSDSAETGIEFINLASESNDTYILKSYVNKESEQVVKIKIGRAYSDSELYNSQREDASLGKEIVNPREKNLLDDISSIFNPKQRVEFSASDCQDKSKCPPESLDSPRNAANANPEAAPVYDLSDLIKIIEQRFDKMADEVRGLCNCRQYPPRKEVIVVHESVMTDTLKSNESFPTNLPQKKGHTNFVEDLVPTFRTAPKSDVLETTSRNKELKNSDNTKFMSGYCEVFAIEPRNSISSQSKPKITQRIQFSTRHYPPRHSCVEPNYPRIDLPPHTQRQRSPDSRPTTPKGCNPNSNRSCPSNRNMPGNETESKRNMTNIYRDNESLTPNRTDSNRKSNRMSNIPRPTNLPARTSSQSPRRHPNSGSRKSPRGPTAFPVLCIQPFPMELMKNCPEKSVEHEPNYSKQSTSSENFKYDDETCANIEGDHSTARDVDLRECLLLREAKYNLNSWSLMKNLDVVHLVQMSDMQEPFTNVSPRLFKTEDDKKRKSRRKKFNQKQLGSRKRYSQKSFNRDQQRF